MKTLKEMLTIMVEKNASDMHLTVGSPIRMRVNGKLEYEESESLTPTEISNYLNEYLNDSRINQLNSGKDIDFSIGISGTSRFRVNIFKQRSNLVATFRRLPNNIPKPNLKPILSLWAEKISERLVPKGESVGYGRKLKTKYDMNISTYDIGYGNGFFRLDENKQFKISDGRDILGRVSMNNLALEGSDNKICIFNNVRELAEFHSTISYEILCRLDSGIDKRII